MNTHSKTAAMLIALKNAILLTVILAILLCAVYPLAVWACAQAAFPQKANGSLITDTDGTVRGSALLGQNFFGPAYFHSRPSAAGAGYDAASSGGANLGPTSQKLADTLRANIDAYRAENRLPDTTPVPADAVTASASGLDPHITLANARLQAPRVAAARRLSPDTLRALIDRHTAPADLGLFGAPCVNVLLLNLALDTEKTPTK